MKFFWKKTDAEVLARRDLKARSVNAICTVAALYPMSAARGFRIPDPALLYTFVRDVGLILQQPNAAAILSTAKGCRSRPQRSKDSFTYPEANFAAFLQSIKKVDCLGTYMEVAWGWAVQIMRANPHTFPPGHQAWGVYATVRNAEIAQRAAFDQPGEPDF